MVDPTGAPVVLVQHAHKAFNGTRAVDDVSFDVRRGEMFGVIGPDGAGKTTSLRLICGLLRLDAGEIRVLGADPFQTRRVAQNGIGYLSQRFSLYGDLSIDENIAFFARVHGVRDFAARRTRLLEVTGLLPFRSRLADRLSGGMKQKLALACTLVHEPPLLVLDEPTTGVDPVSRREFWKLLSEFLADGLTMIFATPYLDEAERCHRVVLLSGGRVLALDAPRALQTAYDGTIYEVIVSKPREALHALTAVFDPRHVQLFGDRLHVRADDEAVMKRIGETLTARRLEVGGIRRILPTLEDVFIERLSPSDGAAAQPAAGRT